MELPRKDSNWELIALLTSPLTCYRLVTEKWVLLLSMVIGPERDARFFFVDIFLMYDKIPAQEKPVCPPVSFGPGGFLYTRCTMASKSYKSYRQQLNILQSRGMVIGRGSQGSRVMHILEHESLKTN